MAPMPYLNGFPDQLLCTATFVEVAGATTVTLDIAPLDATAVEQAVSESLLSSMEGGFGNAFDQLTTYLATIQ